MVFNYQVEAESKDLGTVVPPSGEKATVLRTLNDLVFTKNKQTRDQVINLCHTVTMSIIVHSMNNSDITTTATTINCTNYDNMDHSIINLLFVLFRLEL